MVTEDMYKDKQDNDENNDINDIKEGANMALLARPCDATIMISKEKSKKFIEDSKKNTIKPHFLAECQRYAKLIKREDIGKR